MKVDVEEIDDGELEPEELVIAENAFESLSDTEEEVSALDESTENADDESVIEE